MTESTPGSTPGSTPERLIRSVLTACGSCEDCRHFIGDACLFLPELFRLHDRRREQGEEPTKAQLRHLTDLCNLCGLCPCTKIRQAIMAAKAAYARRDGLAPSVRLLQDVGRLGRFCGAFPRLSNLMRANPLASGVIKQTLGIHKERAMPVVPDQNFDAWVRGGPAHSRPKTTRAGRKAVYFPGCTARFLFPEVARATVEVLEAFGVEVVAAVNHPRGECCGMPPLLEGDQPKAVRMAAHNLGWMAPYVEQGHDLVCSCPTCGYFFKHLLRDGAYYSEAYQQQAGADGTTLRIPVGMGVSGPREGDMVVLRRATYGPILQDKGPFSSLDPLRRIPVGEHAFDLGEYLAVLAEEGRVPEMAHPVPGRAVYYPPCHLREQKIGYPFLGLLENIPELRVVSLTGTLNCFGMAGIMGFKKQFHQASLDLGAPLMDRIRSHQPDAIITDCLSCRLQFQHMAIMPVYHPVQVLHEAIFGKS